LGIVEDLIKAGANVQVTDVRGRTLLMIASARSPSCVEPLIKGGADLNAQDRQYGWTPLMISLIDGNGYSAKQLISARGNLNVQDKNGNTALIHAVMGRKYKGIVEALIAAGADVNIRTRDGKTALSMAQRKFSDNSDDSKVAEILKNAGAVE
jgi:ankyrin repeat protein